MTIYGYARTSTAAQTAGLDDQLAKLRAAGCEVVFQEQVSSVRMEDRVEFAKALAALKANDVLIFTSLSRVARSMIHMMEIEAKVAAAGATIQILDMSVDTSTPQGRLTFNLFSSIAQFERENMLERQKVGIAAAKAEGKYKGRAATARAKSDDVRTLLASGKTRQQVADALHIGVASVYRILKAA